MVSAAFALGGKRRAFTVSGNYAVGLPNGAVLFDTHGTAWRATGGNQVSVNGVTDTSTSGVIKIVYVGIQIWQVAPSGWYFKTFPSDAWTFNTPGLYSADNATVNLGETGGLVDPRNFVWTLTPAGVIVVDGTADTNTHDVTQLVYFGNQIWQNTIFGWYHKTLPTDAWTFSSTAPGVGGTGGNNAVLLGAQLGDPAGGNGSTLFDSFRAAMGEGPSVFTTYAVPDECKRDSNNNCIGAADWGPVGQWQDVANYSAHGINVMNGWTGAKPVTIPIVGVPMAQFANQFGITTAQGFTQIQNGDWDYRFDAIYQAYIDHGFTTIISRPGWEMNGDWEAWSVFRDGSNASEFVNAFRHIANHAYAFATAKGITIKLCWNPGYLPDSNRPNFNSFYPGDAYVDHIGIDTYGLCSNVPDTGPQATYPGDPTHFSMDDAIAMCVAKGKPLCFPETGTGAGETVFQDNLRKKMVANPNCKVSFVSIWDQPTGCNFGSWIPYWSPDAQSSAAWKTCFNAIRDTNGPW